MAERDAKEGTMAVQVTVTDGEGRPLGEWYVAHDGTRFQVPEGDWPVLIERMHSAVQKRWVAGSHEDIRFLALALCGETGELANLIKKCWRGDFRLKDREAEIRGELADVRIYLELLARMLNVDLDQAVRDKLPELYARWPEALPEVRDDAL